MANARKKFSVFCESKSIFGRIEDICVKLVGISGNNNNLNIDKKVILIFSADHGVYKKNTIFDNKKPAYNRINDFLNGISPGAVLSKVCNADSVIVDVGIDDSKIETNNASEINNSSKTKVNGSKKINYNLKSKSIILNQNKSFFNYKIRNATSDILQGQAMSRNEAIRSIEVGIEVAESYIIKDYNIIGASEISPASEISAAAIVSVVTGKDPKDILDKYFNCKDKKYVDEAELEKLASIVMKVIEINTVNPSDGIEILYKLGGFEIGAIVGAILGCSANKIPIVLDNLTSYASALIAYKINYKVFNYIFSPSFCDWIGNEHTFSFNLDNPVIDLNIRLSEGYGISALFNLLDMAVKTYNNIEV
jgi:nicotinate-nucleotide--dimethylbenzimidazole phosphoribosyltransferase